MDFDIESEIIKVIDIEMKGLSLLREQIDSSVKNVGAKIIGVMGETNSTLTRY